MTRAESPVQCEKGKWQRAKTGECKQHVSRWRQSEQMARALSFAICFTFAIFQSRLFHFALPFASPAGSSPACAADMNDKKSRHSLRLRLEVRRRPLRPDDGRHGLEEAFPRKAASSCPNRCSTSATIAQPSHLNRRPRWSLAEDEEDRRRTISAPRSASGAASSGRPGEGGDLRPGDQVRRFLRPAEPKVHLPGQDPDQFGRPRSRTSTSSRCSTPCTGRRPAAAGRRPGGRGELEEEPEPRRSAISSTAADGVPEGWDQGRRPAARAAGRSWSAGWPKRATPATRSSASRSIRTSPRTRA